MVTLHSRSETDVKCQLSSVRRHISLRSFFLLFITAILLVLQHSNCAQIVILHDALPLVWSFSLTPSLPSVLQQHRQQYQQRSVEFIFHPIAVIPGDVRILRRFDTVQHGLKGQNRIAEVFSSEDENNDDDDDDNSASTRITTTASSLLLNDTDAIHRSMSTTRNSKADLYSNEELMELFQIHQTIATSVPDLFGPLDSAASTTTTTTAAATIGEETNRDDIPTVALSLQDLIVQTVQDIEQTTMTTTTNTTIQPYTELSKKFRTSFTQEELFHKVRNVRAIISDVDGTLLGSHNHQLHPTTAQAIENAVTAAYQTPSHPLQYFFPATGKTRIGARNSLGSNIATLLQQCPGVYVQGLYCLNENGEVIFEKKLTRDAIEQVEVFVTQLQQQSQSQYPNITLLAYDGDVIYYNPHMANHVPHLQDVSRKYGEPAPIPLDSHFLLSTYEPSFHKVLIMGDNPMIMSHILRPQLEALVVASSSLSSGSCVVTQAIPTMLEVLPGGCSKAYGVQQVCEYYGINVTTQTCTIGDAENDYDMIRMASIGIAVGNAIPLLQNVADIVMVDASTDGAAGQAIEWFGLGKIIESTEE